MKKGQLKKNNPDELKRFFEERDKTLKPTVVGSCSLCENAEVNCSMSDETADSKKENKAKKRKLTKAERRKRAEKKYDRKLIKEFFSLNRKRGISRKELTEFLQVSSYEIAKAIVVKLELTYYLRYIIDLRKSGKPNIKICYPKHDSDEENMANDSSLEEKMDENEEAKSETASEDTNDLETNQEQGDDVSEEDVSELKQEAEESEHSNQESHLPDGELFNEFGNNTLIIPADVIPLQTPNSQTEEVKKEESVSAQKTIDFDTVKRVKVNSLFKRIDKTKNFIIDLEMMNTLKEAEFYEVIEEISSMNARPVMWFFLSDIMYIDSIKEKKYSAQHLLKFIASEENDKYYHLVSGTRPKGKDFIDFCKANNLNFVSGDASDIIRMRINDVSTYVPTYYKRLVPSPLKGTGKVGFDTSVVLRTATELQKILEKYSSIVLCDTVFDECFGRSHYLIQVCAYYGRIRKTDKSISVKDMRIVEFYQRNIVDVVYTADYGFKAYSLFFSNVNCILIKNDNSTPSIIKNRIERNQSCEWKGGVITGEFVEFNSEYANCSTGTLVFCPNEFYDIKVFDSTGKKKETSASSMMAFQGDYVSINDKTKCLIAVIVNHERAFGKVIFYGSVKAVPNRYKMYL